jgi:hypothetical protein
VQSAQPIIVRVMEEPVRTTTWADVFLGSFGLAAALILSALLLGLALGGLFISIKRLRARYGREPLPDAQALRVTPTTTT